jgi:predicted RNA-binding protein YlqC (UPF0109 family)
MKDLITKIAKAVVDQPDQVSVTEIEGDQMLVLELRVAKSDMGQIIGRRGQTANAMRTILSGVAGKKHKRVTLEIVE